MTQVTAKLKYYRQSPRKVRLVANLVRGKKLEDAIVTLRFTNKRASSSLQKLLSSAQSNAKSKPDVRVEDLIVKEIKVDAGPTLKRSMPRARGSAYPIRKRTSHITLILGTK